VSRITDRSISNPSTQAVVVDLLGIGIGPSNLSLAALATETEISTAFIDSKPSFSWHSDMMLPESKLQVGYVKDCVTLVSPTNKHSFLNYLAENGRLFQFINRRSDYVYRREFELYYQWVASKLQSLQFGDTVESLSYQSDRFVATSKFGRRWSARYLAVGTGQTPYLPDWAKYADEDRIVHTSRYGSSKTNFAGARIAIVGGGQSGAEVMLDILKLTPTAKEVHWITRRVGFQPMDDAAFSNEFYMPAYVEKFLELPQNKKRQLLDKQHLTSNGISSDLINTIYDELYAARYFTDEPRCIELCSNTDVVGLQGKRNSIRLLLKNTLLERSAELDVDYVVLATGYTSTTPPFLTNFLDERGVAGGPILEPDYSVCLRDVEAGRLFLSNFGLLSHGINDPNLSLSSWRSATILNSLLNKKRFNTGSSPSFVAHF
jgi:lysine N6-hydroxylase